MDQRSQDLTGGVDTRSGWRHWNEDGTFVTRYVRESAPAGITPVFTYHDDLRLALRQMAEGERRVVLHVEPDLWGFAQQRNGDDAARTPAAVASSGDPELAGLPDTLAGFAQAVVRLRDRHAPNVLVGWHLSTWGTNRSTTADDPSPRAIDALAARSAAFARSLGPARFDLVFNDGADRDDGFRTKVLKERRVVHHWGRGRTCAARATRA